MTNLQLSPQAAANKLLGRRKARESLVEYARFIDIPGKPLSDDEDEEFFEPVETSLARHHIMMLETSQAIIEGRIKGPDGKPIRQCMIFAPPGSAKSTYEAVVVPTWVMGKNPRTQIILSSYNSTLCKKQGRKARQVCGSGRFASLFGAALRSDMRAADEWALDNGSEYMSGGILSGLTGNRADGIVWDDLISGRQDADSETIRASTWSEYRDSLLTRLKPNGWEIGIQTRWHEDDVPGRILPHDWAGDSGVMLGTDGRYWIVLNFQAKCERKDDPLGRKIGEYIWPEWFPPGHFDKFENAADVQGRRSWHSLYQGIPTAEEGTSFKREWFSQTMYPAHQIADKIEQGNIYLTGDYAVTADGGDYTEIAAWSMLPSEHLYCVGWWSGQVDQLDWCEELLDMVETFHPLKHIAESGVIRKATESYIKRRMRERKDFTTLEWLPSTQNKLANARSFQALASNGRVHFPDTIWAERVISQLLRFPSGRYDDAVDACGLIGRFIDNVWQAQKPKHVQTLEEAWSAQPTMNQMLGRS
jgi:predicted phage terminase large subunit-like protein